MRKVPGNEEVVAFVEPLQGKEIDPEILKNWLRERVSLQKTFAGDHDGANTWFSLR